MGNLKQRVIETLKWKKDPMYCATKLNITEKQYIKLKKEVRQDTKRNKKYATPSGKNKLTESIDLEKGTGEVTGTFDHEPKSSDEIIELLKIDTTKWKLSQYWNKQMGDHWRVSALISPSGKEQIVPIPTFRCDDCGFINDEFRPIEGK